MRRSLVVLSLLVLTTLCLAGCKAGVSNPGPVLGTNDSGWTLQSSPSLNDLLAVSFSDTLHGFAVGVLTVLHTRNGGATWVSQIGAVPGLIQFNGVSSPDSLHAWMVGVDGFIYSTVDGGTSWTKQQPSVPGAILNAVRFRDRNNGWACGRRNNGEGVILYTNNGGQIWSEAATNGLHEVQSISFGTSGAGVACGVQGQIAYSVDGGATWKLGNSGTTFALQAIGMAPGAGGQFAIAGGVLGAALTTSDGGRTWSRSQSLPAGMEVRGASMANFNQAWIAGVASGIAQISYSPDGGLSWYTQGPLSRSNALNAIQMLDVRHGWAVGDGGTIYHTHTGGN